MPRLVEVKETVPPLAATAPPMLAQLPPTDSVADGSVVVPVWKVIVWVAVAFVSRNVHAPPAPAKVMLKALDPPSCTCWAVVPLKYNVPLLLVNEPPELMNEPPTMSVPDGNVTEPEVIVKLRDDVANVSRKDHEPDPPKVRL